MKKSPGAVFISLALLFSWAVIPGVEAEDFNQQKSWVMDLSHADVSFSVRVLGIFEVNGEFARLQDFVGRPLDDRRRAELYRTRVGGDVFLLVAGRFLAYRKGLRCARTMVDLASWRERSLARG